MFLKVILKMGFQKLSLKQNSFFEYENSYSWAKNIKYYPKAARRCPKIYHHFNCFSKLDVKTILNYIKPYKILVNLFWISKYPSTFLMSCVFWISLCLRISGYPQTSGCHRVSGCPEFPKFCISIWFWLCINMISNLALIWLRYCIWIQMSGHF